MNAASPAGEIRSTRARDGAVLQYEVVGHGPPLVFLHGTFGGREDFKRQLPLAADHRLILRDLRGHNGSESRVPRDYSIPTTEVADLDAVLDAEQIGRADVAGHSTGGAIALAYAMARPERVRRLVLIEATLIGLVPPELQAIEHTQRGEANALAERGDLRGAVDLTLGRALGTNWRETSSSRTVARADASAAMQVPVNNGLLALGTTRDELHALPMPVLVIHGGNSTRLHGAVYDAIAATRPGWRLLRLEGAGHAVHVQRADEVNAVIRAFLDEGSRQ